MNEQGAIKDLQEYIGSGEYNGTNPPIYLDTARKAISALEKQVPKKIYHYPWNGIDGVPYDLCPSCETNLCTSGAFGRKKMDYCEGCGQKLDWN